MPRFGELESAGATGGCPGEGAAFVPEQFSFHERRCQRAAIHDDQRLVAAATLPVHGLGDELLAGSGLAGHEHGGVGGGDLLDPIQQPREGGRPANDVSGLGAVSLLTITVRFASETRFQPYDLFQRVLESVFSGSAGQQVAGEGDSCGFGGPAGLAVPRQATVGMHAGCQLGT